MPAAILAASKAEETSVDIKHILHHSKCEGMVHAHTHEDVARAERDLLAAIRFETVVAHPHPIIAHELAALSVSARCTRR